MGDIVAFSRHIMEGKHVTSLKLRELTDVRHTHKCTSEPKLLVWHPMTKLSWHHSEVTACNYSPHGRKLQNQSHVKQPSDLTIMQGLAMQTASEVFNNRTEHNTCFKNSTPQNGRVCFPATLPQFNYTLLFYYTITEQRYGVKATALSFQ